MAFWARHGSRLCPRGRDGLQPLLLCFSAFQPLRPCEEALGHAQRHGSNPKGRRPGGFKQRPGLELEGVCLAFSTVSSGGGGGLEAIPGLGSVAV